MKRFLQKIVVDEGTGCWVWQASLRNGYGQFNSGRKMIKAHRLLVSALPAGTYTTDAITVAASDRITCRFSLVIRTTESTAGCGMTRS